MTLKSNTSWDFHQILIVFILIPLVIGVVFSIWAVYDISKLTKNSREKHKLVFSVLYFPIWGVINYVLNERPKLLNQDHGK